MCHDNGLNRINAAHAKPIILDSKPRAPYPRPDSGSLPVSGKAASGRGKTACDAHPGRGGLPVTRAITAGRGAVLAHDAGQLAGVGGLVAVIYKGLDRTRDVAGA